jgi:hypothetical protein
VANVNNEDVHQAWIHLQEVFVPNKEIDLVAMNQGFTNLRLEDNEEDPKLYVTKLEHVNERYKSVDRKYKKDDLEMITQIFAVLQKTYATPITSRKLLGIEKATLNEVKEELHEYWQQFIEKKAQKE